MSAIQVMIVEDESVIALDIKSSLGKLGYAVSGMAASGDVALRKIEATRPDLVLMDIHLKGEMTGIEVSEKIKSHFQIPIVYLTANADSSTFQAAIGTDPYGYVLKPFKEKELGIAIEIALHQHQKGQVTRSSESWYATAFQSLDEAVIATDPNGLIVFMNAAAEFIMDCLLVDVIDQPILEVLKLQRKIQQLDTTDLTHSMASILEAVMRGRKAVSLPHHAQIVTQALKTTPIEGSATAIRDSSGTIIGSIFIFRQAQNLSGWGVQPSAADSLTPEDLTNEQINEGQTTEGQTTEGQMTEVEPLEVESLKNYTDEEVALVKAFTQAFIERRAALLSTPKLRAESSVRSTTLASQAEGPIVNVRLIKDKLTVIVKQESAYWNLIRHVLIENSFFPVSQRSNGTHYFQHRMIPNRCQIYHTCASELVKFWQGKASHNHASSKITRHHILVLRRGSWHHIQRLICVKDQLQIKTIGGEMFMALEEPLIWGLQA
ncbi:MAG: response regulator [Phormidesmis sp.]